MQCGHDRVLPRRPDYMRRNILNGHGVDISGKLPKRH